MNKNLIAKVSTIIDAPKARVWEALVNPADIKQYMFGTHAVSDWKKGSSIVWKGVWQGKTYEDKGVILEFKPQEFLQYSHFSPLSGLPDEPDSYHTVSITLTAEDTSTLFSLEQDHNSSEEEREHSAKNWEMMLFALKAYLEKK